MQVLRINIVRLVLPPGSLLVEQDISDILRIGRTPIREALIKLSQENLLEVFPQRGTYVSLIDSEKVEESRFLRNLIEAEVMQLACADFPEEMLLQLKSFIALQEMCINRQKYVEFFELDEGMHGTIFSACRKGRIWSAIQQMSADYNRDRMLNLASGYDWLRLIEQHKEYVRAIEQKDRALGTKL